MPPWLILLAALLLASAATAGLYVGWVAPRRLAIRRRVLVNLLDGRAVAGVLWTRVGGVLILKDATVHEPGAQPVPVDGEVLVERHRVDFMQVL